MKKEEWSNFINASAGWFKVASKPEERTYWEHFHERLKNCSVTEWAPVATINLNSSMDSIDDSWLPDIKLPQPQEYTIWDVTESRLASFTKLFEELKKP